MTPEAFSALVRPHLGRLHRFAYRLTGSAADAEDLVQELLIKVYPRRQDLAEIDRPLPWLTRVMYRLFIDQHRRQSRSPLHLVVDNTGEDGVDTTLDSLPDDTPEPDEAHERELRQEQLARAVERLSEDHRTAVTLHDVEGYTLEEMQEILDCPIGTLKSRLHRARARLRELLEESE